MDTISLLKKAKDEFSKGGELVLKPNGFKGLEYLQASIEWMRDISYDGTIAEFVERAEREEIIKSIDITIERLSNEKNTHFVE